MESSDKAMMVVLICVFGFLTLGAIASSTKDIIVAAEMANAGLQQCVVTVNDKEEIL